jgi:hypothetical protein
MPTVFDAAVPASDTKFFNPLPFLRSILLPFKGRIEVGMGDPSALEKEQ